MGASKAAMHTCVDSSTVTALLSQLCGRLECERCMHCKRYPDALINAMHSVDLPCCEVHEEREEAVDSIGSDVQVVA